MSDEEKPPRHRRKVSDAEVAQASKVIEQATVERIFQAGTPRENMPPTRVLGRFAETLTCKLTRLEIEEKRAEALQRMDEVERLEAELDAVKQAMKAKITRAKAACNDARRISSAAIEDREVEVIAELHDTTVIYIRTDTFEEVRRRHASPAELQGQLFG